MTAIWMEALDRTISSTANSTVFDPVRVYSAVLEWVRAHYAEIVTAALLTAMCIHSLAVISRKSITIDEIVLIPAAYYYSVTDDIALVREHPPMCKLLAGLPLLLVQPNEIATTAADKYMNRVDRDWKYEMGFWQENRGLEESISFWSRVPMIMLTLALGALIFILSRALFGPLAAIISVALFTIEPTVLAHSRVVQTDIPAAFGFLLTILLLYYYLLTPTYKMAAGLGGALGLAMLTKFSLAVLPPALLIVFLVLLWKRPLRRRIHTAHAVVALIVLVMVVNAAYFFNNHPLTEADAQWVVASFPRANAVVLTSIRFLRFLFPTDFLIGIYWQLHHSSQGHPSSLLGMYGRSGWWYYYPVAFALKTTIPFLLLSVTSLTWAIHSLTRKRERKMLVLLIPFFLYTGFMMLSPIDIGIRYYLPAYPFLFILSGGWLAVMLQKRGAKILRLAAVSVLVVTFAWMILELRYAYPNYIPYLNQLASARPNWWYLSDSNVEWGDDLKELAKYLHERGETRVRSMALGDFITLSFYGVERVSALESSHGDSPRYTVLGASFLNGSTVPEVVEGKRLSEEERIHAFDWFRNQKPEVVIGNSLYVYRMHD